MNGKKKVWKIHWFSPQLPWSRRWATWKSSCPRRRRRGCWRQRRTASWRRRSRSCWCSWRTSAGTPTNTRSRTRRWEWLAWFVLTPNIFRQMVGWKQCDGSLMRLRRRSPEKRLTGERSGHYLIKFSSFYIKSKRSAHNFLCLGSARAGRLCWVERGDEQGNQQPEEQAQVGVQSGGGSNLSLLVPIKISSPNFSFFLLLHIYCVCCNRELADCENIAFLTANADSTKKSRYMGGVVLSVWDWRVCGSRCEYCDQYLPLCVWASLGLFHCCLSPISKFLDC